MENLSRQPEKKEMWQAQGFAYIDLPYMFTLPWLFADSPPLPQSLAVDLIYGNKP